MTPKQLQEGNDLVKLKDDVFQRFNNSRKIITGQLFGDSHTYSMARGCVDLEDFEKTCKNLMTVLFDAEEKRLNELFDKRLSNI